MDLINIKKMHKLIFLLVMYLSIQVNLTAQQLLTPNYLFNTDATAHKYLNAYSTGMETKKLVELNFNGYKFSGQSREQFQQEVFWEYKLPFKKYCYQTCTTCLKKLPFL